MITRIQLFSLFAYIILLTHNTLSHAEANTVRAENSTPQAPDCYFDNKQYEHCIFQSDEYNVSVRLSITKKRFTERLISSAKVQVNDKAYELPITPGTVIRKGDIGLISFSDINFDNIPDLAVSTSFGLANQAFDYWVFNPNTQEFLHVGNFVNLVLDPNQKSVTSIAKSNAAIYIKREYFWKGFSLVPKITSNRL